MLISNSILLLISDQFLSVSTSCCPPTKNHKQDRLISDWAMKRFLFFFLVSRPLNASQRRIFCVHGQLCYQKHPWKSEFQPPPHMNSIWLQRFATLRKSCALQCLLCKLSDFCVNKNTNWEYCAASTCTHILPLCFYQSVLVNKLTTTTDASVLLLRRIPK